MLFSSCPCVLSRFASVPFHCISWFISGKGWQLTCVQHTRKLESHAAYEVAFTCVLLTTVQHTKYGSCAVHKTYLACSTWKFTRVQPIGCHTRFLTESLDKNWRTQMCSAHTSVNLDVSCTIVGSLMDSHLLWSYHTKWTYLQSYQIESLPLTKQKYLL